MSTKNELVLENQALKHQLELAREAIVKLHDQRRAMHAEHMELHRTMQAELDARPAAKAPKAIFVARTPTPEELAANNAWKAMMAAAREQAISSGRPVLIASA